MVHKHSINNVNIIDLLVVLMSTTICFGISKERSEERTQAMFHVVPVAIVPSDDATPLNPYSNTAHQKSLACVLLTENTAFCNECSLLV